MKKVIDFCVGFGLFLALFQGGLAHAGNSSVQGIGHAVSANPSNTGCDDRDSLHTALLAAEADADSNALSQCGTAQANRIGDFSITTQCKYWGAVAFVQAQAIYECE